MIINRIYEIKSSVAVACFLPGRVKDLSAPVYNVRSKKRGIGNVASYHLITRQMHGRSQR